MIKKYKLIVLRLSLISLAANAETVQKGPDEKTTAKINQAILNLEKSLEKQQTIGSEWIAAGKSWEKMQRQFEFVTQSCQPERVAEMKQKKKLGKIKADQFIQSFAPIMALPTITEDDKKNPCELFAKLADFKKARVELNKIRVDAKKSGFPQELNAGIAEIQEGYASYSILGDASAFIAEQIVCDGKVDPGPTMRTGIKRLSLFSKNTADLISNISDLEKKADQLIAELKHLDGASCPQPQASTDSPTASSASITPETGAEVPGSQ